MKKESLNCFYYSLGDNCNVYRFNFESNQYISAFVEIFVKATYFSYVKKDDLGFTLH